ncbi:MAG: peptide-methionine (R)-S-oxide reductase MsrB [Planctomycetota bacterium]
MANHQTIALTAACLTALCLIGCNQEPPPTYDASAQQIDPAIKLYTQDSETPPPAPHPESDPAQTPPTAAPEDQANPMPQDTDPTPTIARSTDPEAMVNADKVELTDEQWQSILSDEEFYILRRSGTERRFTGRFLNETGPGSYHCAGCGMYLYDAKHKFHSGCGWPSFNQEVAQGALTYYVDRSAGMVRTEMRCARCDGHLGHVFNDAPDQPTGLRHCVNGGALIFVPEGADVAQTIREHRRQHADR